MPRRWRARTRSRLRGSTPPRRPRSRSRPTRRSSRSSPRRASERGWGALGARPHRGVEEALARVTVADGGAGELGAVVALHAAALAREDVHAELLGGADRARVTREEAIDAGVVGHELRLVEQDRQAPVQGEVVLHDAEAVDERAGVPPLRLEGGLDERCVGGRETRAARVGERPEHAVVGRDELAAEGAEVQELASELRKVAARTRHLDPVVGRPGDPTTSPVLIGKMPGTMKASAPATLLKTRLAPGLTVLRVRVSAPAWKWHVAQAWAPVPPVCASQKSALPSWIAAVRSLTNVPRLGGSGTGTPFSVCRLSADAGPAAANSAAAATTRR